MKSICTYSMWSCWLVLCVFLVRRLFFIMSGVCWIFIFFCCRNISDYIFIVRRWKMAMKSTVYRCISLSMNWTVVRLFYRRKFRYLLVIRKMILSFACKFRNTLFIYWWLVGLSMVVWKCTKTSRGWMVNVCRRRVTLSTSNIFVIKALVLSLAFFNLFVNRKF